MTAPRLLVIGLNFEPEQTGIAPYTAGMVDGLSEFYDVTVVTTNPHYPDWKVWEGYGGRSRETRSGADVVRLPHYVPSKPAGRNRILSEMSFAIQALFSGAGRADAIIAVSPALLSIAPAHLLGRRWSAPVGVVVQDLYSRAASELGLLGARAGRAVGGLESRMLRSAAGVVTIHPTMRDALIRSTGIPEARVEVIRNWCHVEEPIQPREATRGRLGWGSEIVALHAGNMGAKQGLTNVVDAARIAKERGLGIRFVLMGDGATRRQLQHQSQGLDPYLTFMAPVSSSDFPEVLGAADVLLLNERPDLIEMCAPSKLTSYLAAGRPVLAATQPESAAAFDMSRSGGGLVVEPGNPGALIEGLESLAGQPSENFSQPGRSFVASDLAQDVAIGKYRDWVERLLRSDR